MKTALSVILTIVIAGIMMSCSQPKPVKTIEDLKTAYNGESTASAKYAKYAEKAKEEGLDYIAKLFEAASKAESIHAGNHKKVLVKLGEKIEGPTLKSFEVKTTKENLADAIAGESYEFDTMYPDFINTSNNENNDDAKKSFTWALDTEKKHKEFYVRALDILNMGTQKPAPVKWYVCSVCGNTYDEKTISEACDFCKTKKEKFFVV